MSSNLCYVIEETGIGDVGCISVRTTNQYYNQYGRDRTEYYLFLANAIKKYKECLISSGEIEEFSNSTLCCLIRYKLLPTTYAAVRE